MRLIVGVAMFDFSFCVTIIAQCSFGCLYLICALCLWLWVYCFEFGFYGLCICCYGRGVCFVLI